MLEGKIAVDPVLLPLLWFLLATGNIHSDICLGNSKEEFEAVLFMLGKIQFVVFPVELTIFSTMNLVSVAFHLGFGAGSEEFVTL
mmetsp:Transcript_47945/g.113186  ORF Transcript_47945/g.113186 Transcript_47945/m.113186 type:complete len:85 (-) Transcript_47945:267-521(-)